MPAIPKPSIRSDLYLAATLEVLRGDGIFAFNINAFNPSSTTSEEIVRINGGSKNDSALFPVISGELLTLISDNAADTAIDILISGLDANFDEQEEVVATNGTSSVNTTKTYTRINSAFVINKKGLLGTLSISGAGGNYGQITSDAQQMEQAIYTVPRGKVGALKQINTFITKSSGGTGEAAFAIYFRKILGDVGSFVENDYYTRAFLVGNQTDGTTSVSFENIQPTGVLGPADIVSEATASANSIGLDAFTSVMIVDLNTLTRESK